MKNILAHDWPEIRGFDWDYILYGKKIGPIKFIHAAKRLEEYQKEHGTIAFTVEENDVFEDAKCGTVGCLGGHYLLATEWRRFNTVNGGGTYFDQNDKELEWREGANKLAEDLGFAKQGMAARWAMQQFFFKHPEIWGNDRGEACFYSWSAYQEVLSGRIPCDECDESYPHYHTLQPVIDKFRAVAQRLHEAGGFQRAF